MAAVTVDFKLQSNRNDVGDTYYRNMQFRRDKFGMVIVTYSSDDGSTLHTVATNKPNALFDTMVSSTTNINSITPI